ncbi:uncharacterized protein LOC134745326 [Cydia strobilella]|uniref:uncharacterized protein LOC134745326 n=1 Tax=Cydia strobilella TaxID=1100964 RepID=UPI00300462CC
MTSPKVRAPWRVGSSRGELLRRNIMDEHRSENPDASTEATRLIMDSDPGVGERAKRTFKYRTPSDLRIRQQRRATRAATMFVVMTNPFTELTLEQAEHIKGTLESCLMKLANVQTEDTYCPSFLGTPRYSEGVLKLRCEGMKDVEWLQDAVATITSPIPGTDLVVQRQRAIPRRLKCAVLLPFCSDDTETIHNILITQNEWYKISKWALYKVERTEDPPGTFLVIGIPFDEISTVMARERRLLYKEKVGYIRFFGKMEKLEDVPPGVFMSRIEAGASDGLSAEK